MPPTSIGTQGPAAQLKIVFLVATSKQPPWLEDVIHEYIKKLSFWFSTEVKNLSTKKIDRDQRDVKVAAETESFLKFLKDEDFVILCDEKGKSFDSMEFSRTLERVFQSGKKRLIFLIGGAYGVGPEIKERAQLTLSLSALTLNHHMALAILMEQVYRGVTILKGIRYHNE